MLAAIFLSVAPGFGDYPTLVAAFGLLAVVLYAVEALGQIYDLGADVAAEVRS